MGTGEGPAVAVNGVRKAFGSRASLDGVTLEIQRNEVFGLLGPNGAGKTTLLRALLGLVRPDEGTLRVLGRDPASDGTEVRRSVGVLLEADGLYEGLTALENLEFHGQIHRVAKPVRRSRAAALLGSFGLWGRRHENVATWSRGMRVRLALARAMLHSPRLLLLDEPFAGLDPEAAVLLRALLVGVVQGEGTTVLVTSHDLSHVERTCGRVAVLARGRIVAAGPPSDLGSLGTTVTVEILGDGITASLLESMRGRQLIDSFAIAVDRVEIVCSRDARSRLAAELVAGGARIEEIRTVRRSLEEAFLSLVATAAGVEP